MAFTAPCKRCTSPTPYEDMRDGLCIKCLRDERDILRTALNVVTNNRQYYKTVSAIKVRLRQALKDTYHAKQ